MSNVKTKLKKNYLALVIAIAVLGVIVAALISLYSFADEIDSTNDNTQYTYHVTGKAIDPNDNLLFGATVKITAGYPHQSDYYGTVDSNGEFDINFSSESEFNWVGYLNIYYPDPEDISLWYYNNDSDYINVDKDYGTIKVPYSVVVYNQINGVMYYDEHELGTWYRDNQPMAASSNGGLPGYFFYHASYVVNGNAITFTADETSVQPAREEIFRFEASSGHTFYRLDVQQNRPLENVALQGGKIYVNAVVDNPGPVPPTPTLYAVTFGENINKVLANGLEIASGTEVEEGTSLQIIPAVAEEKVTKVYVNDSVCPTCLTTVNSDIDIDGQMFDSVKLSGKVVTWEEEQPDAFKAVSKLFIDKAYATGAGVEGAIVTFTDATDGWYASTVSDSNGEFELDVVQGNAGTLTVSKDGYEPYSKEIDGNDLEDDYIINPALKAINKNPENNNSSTSSTPQTGDTILYAIFIMAIVASSTILFRTTKQNSYKHIR